MKNIIVHIVYLSVIAILSSLMYIHSSENKKIVEIERITTDTIVHERYDTIIVHNPIFIERELIDTIYVKTDSVGNAIIPISSYRFFEQDKYDITATGFNVALDKVSVFPKTKHSIITNTIEKEVLVYKWDIYGGIGISYIGKDFSPNIGVMVKSPQKWMIGAKVGIYDKRPTYEVLIQYKLTK